MKATEFVKKFGIHIADQCLNDCASPGDKWFIHRGELICGEDFDDLKRLVESHELVERMIKDHNKSFPECQIDLIGLKSFAHGKYGKIFPKKLKQAIKDVEACQ